jgi:hypothetical protein
MLWTAPRLDLACGFVGVWAAELQSPLNRQSAPASEAPDVHPGLPSGQRFANLAVSNRRLAANGPQASRLNSNG